MAFYAATPEGGWTTMPRCLMETTRAYATLLLLGLSGDSPRLKLAALYKSNPDSMKTYMQILCKDSCP